MKIQFIFCTLLSINFLYLGCKIKLNGAARAQKDNHCLEHLKGLRIRGSMLNINESDKERFSLELGYNSQILFVRYCS